MIAAITGHADIVKLFLARGADVNVKAANGTTALSVAQLSGNAEIVQLLKQSGAKGN